MFKIPVSIKAITAAATAFVLNEVGSLTHVALSQGVTALIASAIGLAIAWAVPEGVGYIDAWLSKEGLPAVIDIEASTKPPVASAPKA